MKKEARTGSISWKRGNQNCESEKSIYGSPNKTRIEQVRISTDWRVRFLNETIFAAINCKGQRRFLYSIKQRRASDRWKSIIAFRKKKTLRRHEVSY